RGGQVVAQGTVDDIMASEHSLTGRYLRDPLHHPMQPRRAIASDHPFIIVRDAHKHNLRNVDARIPAQRLTVVTGVSGSGKSTLARDVLLTSLSGMLHHTRNDHTSNEQAVQGCRRIEGSEHIDRVLEVDQTPIGKTPRSCPATYIGFWDAIRRLFASTQEAR